MNNRTTYGTICRRFDDTFVFKPDSEDVYLIFVKNDDGWNEISGFKSGIAYPEEVIDGIGSEIDLYLSKTPKN